MTTVPMTTGSPPHGGALVDLRLDGVRAVEVAGAARTLPAWELSRRQRCDLELLANGGFSPLRTFLDRADYESVCDTMRLSTGELWPVPVTLDLPEHVVRAAESAGGLTLRDRGSDVAVLWFGSAWQPDRRAEAAAVYGTTDRSHPGVHALLDATHPWYVSGRLDVLTLPAHHDFRSLRHTPAQLRTLMAERGWRRVVAFQTRNPIHRAHQELTLRAARELDADLLLHPVVGITKPGDVDPYVRVRCYRALLPTYPAGRVLLSVLPLAMRMAGPREALWHAIIRKNHGATHFVVGRDHAGPGDDARGHPFYPTYAAQELVRRHADEIGMGIATFPQMVYVHELEAYVPEDEVRDGHHRMQISGTEQRRRLSQGAELPAWFTPPQVAAELRRAFPPRSARGVAVFLGTAVTGWPGAADAVVASLREAGRTVTVLDESIPDAVDGPPALMAHLVGEVMRNGGAVVCVGPVAERLASAGTGLAGHGLVLDVRDGDGSRGVLDAVSFPHHEVLPLVVPRGASADLVGEVVGHHLRMSGYMAAESVRADVPLPKATH